MKRCFFALWSLTIVCPWVEAQQEINWQMLANVKWTPVYFAKYDTYFDMPEFGKKVKDLDGKEVKIKGFYVPVDPSGSMFALSAYPSNMCFFCNGAGLESVIEVAPRKGETKLKHVTTDKYIEIKGKMKLNKSEEGRLMYIMEETELLRIVK